MFSLREIAKHLWMTLPPITLSALLAAMAVLAVDVLDSFGLDQEADEQAARMIGVVEGPLYGIFEGRRGQKAVTVVLIDDTTLKDLNWRVPVRYSDQADLVSILANYDPAAIFLDFSYTRPHGDNPRAEIIDFRNNLIAQTQNGRVPIMIGEVEPEFPEDRSALAPLERGVQQVGVRWTAASWVAYPFRSDDNRETAAPALYDAYCARQHALKNPDPTQCNWRPPLGGELAMTWGFGASRESAALLPSAIDNRCIMADDKFWTRVKRSAEQVYQAVFRASAYDPERGHDPIQSRCIYSDTMTAAQVFSENPEIADRVAAMIKDRVVLIGSSHRFTSDRHIIPHIGSVPGVMVHAMALDNLITDEENYTRPPPPVFLALDWADLIEILLTFALILFMWNANQFARRTQSGKTGRAFILWGAAFISFGVVIGTLLIERLILHWSPLNVFGVAALTVSVFILLEQHSDKVVVEEKST